MVKMLKSNSLRQSGLHTLPNISIDIEPMNRVGDIAGHEKIVVSVFSPMAFPFHLLSGVPLLWVF